VATRLYRLENHFFEETHKKRGIADVFKALTVIVRGDVWGFVYKKHSSPLEQTKGRYLSAEVDPGKLGVAAVGRTNVNRGVQEGGGSDVKRRKRRARHICLIRGATIKWHFCTGQRDEA